MGRMADLPRKAAARTARLAALLERQLGGRKVDIRLWSEGQPLLPIDQVALSQGIPL